MPRKQKLINPEVEKTEKELPIVTCKVVIKGGEDVNRLIEHVTDKLDLLESEEFTLKYSVSYIV